VRSQSGATTPSPKARGHPVLFAKAERWEVTHGPPAPRRVSGCELSQHSAAIDAVNRTSTVAGELTSAFRRGVYVALGANLGDACAALRTASVELGALPLTSLVACSSLYRTAPVDAGGRDYINAVAELQTGLSAHTLLTQLQAIERRHGRERPFRHAPRTLDLDLLLYADEIIDTPSLTVPHPRMHERAFVLLPLVEIWPEAVIPGRGKVSDCLPSVAAQSIACLAPG